MRADRDYVVMLSDWTDEKPERVLASLKVLVDKAEVAKGDGESGQNAEVEAWYGTDYNKAWVKVEGERRGGALESARTELLWDRAFAPFYAVPEKACRTPKSHCACGTRSHASLLPMSG